MVNQEPPCVPRKHFLQGDYNTLLGPTAVMDSRLHIIVQPPGRPAAYSRQKSDINKTGVLYSTVGCLYGLRFNMSQCPNDKKTEHILHPSNRHTQQNGETPTIFAESHIEHGSSQHQSTKQPNNILMEAHILGEQHPTETHHTKIKTPKNHKTVLLH